MAGLMFGPILGLLLGLPVKDLTLDEPEKSERPTPRVTADSDAPPADRHTQDPTKALP
jgi:hypothetical protein